MKRTFAKILAGTLAITMLLTGCGSSATSTEEETGDNVTVQETTATKEITYWSMWNSTEGQAKVIQEAADAYEAETGIKVNIEWKGRDIKTLIGPALSAGEKIDIFDTDYYNICKQFKDNIADLTAMADAVGYKEHALPVLLEATNETTEGKIKAIPYQPFTSGVWYNKEMFANAGIEKAPETFTELLDACEKLKASGVNPMTSDQGDGTLLLYGYQLARYIGQDDVFNLINGNLKWADTPEVKKAAEDIYTLFDKGYMSPYAPANQPDGQNEIGYGESAMILQASWVPNEVSQTTGADIDWGYFPWPAVEGGVDGIEGAMVGAQGFAIPESSQNKQEAFDFIMKLVIGENDLKMANAVASIPADTANTEWPKQVAGAEPYFKNLTKPYLWAVGLQENVDNKDYILEAVNQLCKKEIDPNGFVEKLSKLN